MRSRFLKSAALLLGPLALCACSGGGPGPAAAVDAAPLVAVSPAGAAAVDAGAPVVVTAARGRLTDVVVSSADGRRIAGALAPDNRSWRSSTPLSAGQQYTVRVSLDDGGGGRGSTVQRFSTVPAAKTLTVALAPGDKGVYGVGEPITATLSLPVHDQAARQALERSLTVSSTPSVKGAWYWVDDSTLHFRPQTYWPAQASVRASFDAQGLKIGGDVYGGKAASVAFRTGEKMLAVTDAGTDYMTVYQGGRVLRTLPVTTGKPGFSTRNGIKVVLEQEPEVFMNSDTVGIAGGSSDAYHLHVLWDTRVTWSGEYVHAAPWSVGSQGVANVSHGCTGMSTEDAHWFYSTFRKGDLVQVVNSRGEQMAPFGNGFGDWNLSWADWQKGSALGRVVDTSPDLPAGQAGTVAGVGQVGFIRPQA